MVCEVRLPVCCTRRAVCTRCLTTTRWALLCCVREARRCCARGRCQRGGNEERDEEKEDLVEATRKTPLDDEERRRRRGSSSGPLTMPKSVAIRVAVLAARRPANTPSVSSTTPEPDKRHAHTTMKPLFPVLAVALLLMAPRSLSAPVPAAPEAAPPANAAPAKPTPPTPFIALDPLSGDLCVEHREGLRKTGQKALDPGLAGTLGRCHVVSD